MNKEEKIDRIILIVISALFIMFFSMIVMDYMKTSICEKKLEYNCEQQKCFTDKFPCSEIKQLIYQTCLLEKMTEEKGK